MPGISRVGDVPGLLGLSARVAAKVASGEDQRCGLASAQLVDDASRCLLVSFASAAAHLVFVLIARPWANSRQQDDPRLSALFGGTPGAVADEIVPAARLVAETSDNRKDLECASLPEAFGWVETVVSEVIRLLPSIVAAVSFSFSLPCRRSRKDTEIAQ